MTIYQFVHWVDDYGNVIGTDPVLALTIISDMAVTAVYQEVAVPPPQPIPVDIPIVASGALLAVDIALVLYTIATLSGII